jgi:perosamine synthetase
MFNPVKLGFKNIKEVIKNGFRTSKNKYFNNLLIKKFCKKIGVAYGITVNSGTSGLHVALLSLELKKDDEVIIPAITMSAVAYAVLLAGAKPIFADIDKETLNIDLESIKNKISNKTKVIICVSLFGLPVDYTKLIRIIRKERKKIYLIEDNAECVFAKHKNKYAGSYGDFSVFSFQSSKTLTCGEGGIVLCKDKDLYVKSKMYSNLGYYTNKNSYNKNRLNLQNTSFQRHKLLGFNYRLSEIGAAIVHAQLKNSNKIVNFRKKSGEVFLKLLSNYNFVKTQKIIEENTHSYWAFPIIFKKKIYYDYFQKNFIKNGGDYFYGCWLPPYKEKFYKDLKLTRPSCKNAESLQKRILQLKTNYYDKKTLNLQAKALKAVLEKINNKIKSNDNNFI